MGRYNSYDGPIVDVKALWDNAVNVAAGNWGSVSGVIGGATIIHAQTAPEGTGILGLVLVPKASGIFEAHLRLSWSSDTAGDVVQHNFRTKQGASTGALATVGGNTLTNAAKFGRNANDSRVRGIVLGSDGAGNGGFTFEGGSLISGSQTQHLDQSATVVGGLTANANSGLGGSMGATLEVDAAGPGTTLTPFTTGLPVLFHVTVTANHVLTYEACSLFVRELP